MHSLYSDKDTAITEKVLFIDFDQCLTEQAKEKLTSISANNQVIIEKSCPPNVDQVRYIFLFIDEAKIDNYHMVKSVLEELKEKDTYTLIMTADCPTKSLFNLFMYDLDGIVSIRSFLNSTKRILKTIDEFGVYLEQNLHSDLVIDLQRKKLKDRPIKRLVLRTEDVKYILTDNEKNVLQNILDGHNNRKIAEIMYLAPSTVSTVISHLLKKLGANDRTDAMVHIIRKGWVDAVR
ncbi:response regulator transcription factor [Salipaludibacillus daqingensis]|uniref:response regulator transcription factor n=1 Tax=Salipaludibacillus daqingensis TaxID=3041001 RepID=UPI002475DF1F|nr:LuxR C-terminal-related transcriptional regulator [Salipaludibacillus daqingensis]